MVHHGVSCAALVGVQMALTLDISSCWVSRWVVPHEDTQQDTQQRSTAGHPAAIHSRTVTHKMP